MEMDGEGEKKEEDVQQDGNLAPFDTIIALNEVMVAVVTIVFCCRSEILAVPGSVFCLSRAVSVVLSASSCEMIKSNVK